MNVLLTKHTADEVWEHLARGFGNFEDKAHEYVNKLNGIVCEFRDTRPYDRIDWRRDYKTGSARKHRVQLSMWNGYGDDDYDLLWNFGSDLHILKDEFKDKVDYDRFSRMFADFKASMCSLNKEYERIEKHAWESSQARWRSEDAEWIKYQEFVKEHTYHKTLEEQIKDRDRNIKQYPEDTEALMTGHWKVKDHTLTCSLCRNAKAEKERIEKLMEEREAERLQREEERAIQREAERLATEQAKRDNYANLPTLVCDACKFSTRSTGAFEIHEESKEHKNKVRDQSLFCEKCNHRSRYRAEHEFHLHSKKHLGEVEVKEKPVFFCETCQYTAKNKGNFEYHMSSNKHLKKLASKQPTSNGEPS